MGIFARFINWFLCLIFSSRTVYKADGRLYLRRWFITPRRWLGPGNWPKLLSWVPPHRRKLFLHMIRLSDARTMHDHPWPFTSLILAGKYIEYTLIQGRGITKKDAPAGTVLRNRAEHTHRLEIVKPVWSLVFAGETYREWGFWVDDIAEHPGFYHWVDWRTFLGCPNEPTPPEDAFPADPWFHIEEKPPASEWFWNFERKIEKGLHTCGRTIPTDLPNGPKKKA